MSVPMNTFLAALETAIQTAAAGVSVQLRRTIDTMDKVRTSANEYIVITPGRDLPVRAENASGYLLRVSALVRCCVVYPTDAAAISALATLVQKVRRAIYGQAWGGRLYVEPVFTESYVADPENSNLYYYDVEVIAEYQESATG